MNVPFTHLHVHTQYSLLDGASKPKELLQRAMELGMDSIAITDHGNMYGAVDVYQTAQKLNKSLAVNVILPRGAALIASTSSPVIT